MFTICTASLTFNNPTFCPQCIFAFCIYLTTNSDYFPIQHLLVGFCNRELTLYSPVVTICTTSLTFSKIYVLLTQCYNRPTAWFGFFFSISLSLPVTPRSTVPILVTVTLIWNTNEQDRLPAPAVKPWDPLAAICGDVSEALYRVLVFNKNQSEEYVHSCLLEQNDSCYTPVMNFNSLNVTLVSWHRNAPYHK